MRVAIVLILFLAYLGFMAYLFNPFKEEEAALQPLPEVLDTDELVLPSGADSLYGVVLMAIGNNDYETAHLAARQLADQYQGTPLAQDALALLEEYSNSLANANRSQTIKPATNAARASAATPRRERPSRAIASSRAIKRKAPPPPIPFNPREYKLKPVFDAEKGITWLYHKNLSHFVYKNSIEAYIGHSDDGKNWLRMRIYYNRDKPLFINSFELFADDRQFTISTLYGNLERGEGQGGAWEWYDMRVTAKELEALQAISRASVAGVRYIGEKGDWVRTVSEMEKLRLAQVLRAFQALNRPNVTLLVQR